MKTARMAQFADLYLWPMSSGAAVAWPLAADAQQDRIRLAGVRVIAKQFGVNPGTVQRISRPFEQDAVAPEGGANGSGGRLDSEQFRPAPRTCGRFRGILKLL
jgi:hypothetical protein